METNLKIERPGSEVGGRPRSLVDYSESFGEQATKILDFALATIETRSTIATSPP